MGSGLCHCAFANILIINENFNEKANNASLTPSQSSAVITNSFF